MNKKPILALLALAACSWATPPVLHAQEGKAAGRPQAEVASKSAKFATVAESAREYQDAKDATDLETAAKLTGKTATFRGTVVKVFTPKSNSLVILNFARDYKTALTAVVRKEHFGAFPKLDDLKDKKVLVTGKVVEFEERPEVVLTSPDQLKIVQ